MPGSENGRLFPPEDGGVTIRMYRIGHGDCFLLAFPGRDEGRPVYVLIDCGFKHGSPAKLKSPTSAEAIVADIGRATGKSIDLAILTHEHEDHLNGITEKAFEDFTIGTLWLAWTEDREDGLAEALREKHHDTLIGLTAAAAGMEKSNMAAQSASIEEFLQMELGEPAAPFRRPSGRFGAAKSKQAKDPNKSKNKKSMALFKARAKSTDFLRPDEVRTIPDTDVSAFVLGPPRDEDRLKDTDPEGPMAYTIGGAKAMSSVAHYFADALEDGDIALGSPFGPSWSVPLKEALAHKAGTLPPFKAYCDGNSDWRRIDGDWLAAAGRLALDMNNDTNNTSLVLAFELPHSGGNEATGKILLFAGDAQAGNWRSWADRSFSVKGRNVSAAELLANTVLYKAGHHGSHNATLNGKAGDAWPNLAWMGQGSRAGEFSALITAVRLWAINKTAPIWDHPLPSIKADLLAKAQGRVLQTDTEISGMKQQGGLSSDWNDFWKRLSAPNHLYFDLQILP